MIFPRPVLRATMMGGGARMAQQWPWQPRGRNSIVANSVRKNHSLRSGCRSKALPTTWYAFDHRTGHNRSSRRFLATKPEKPTPAEEEATAAAAASNTTTTTASEEALASVGETTTTTAPTEDLLKAPFSKVHHKAQQASPNQPGAFPWRSSPELLERLVPGTAEHASKGLLLGGGLTSSNPGIDAFATAYVFLRIPFLDLLFFRSATEQDLADSMAWAFGASVRAIAEGFLPKKKDDDDEDSSSSTEEETSDEERGNEPSSPRLRDMMECTKLAKLFESANEFGKGSLRVKLETKPILHNKAFDPAHGADVEDIPGDLPLGLGNGPKIVSLFVFPFLTRDQIQNNWDPHHVRKYTRMIDTLADSQTDSETADNSYGTSLELSRELMEDFRKKGVSENTVICQVLVPCRETFWVEDATTGELVQGDKQTRTVLHLVRFEQVTKTHHDPSESRLFPFRHELGQWKITDIDDLCDGNLLF